MRTAPLSLPPWTVGPEDLPSQPKSTVLEILDSALTIAALYWPVELSARQPHILHNLDKALQQQASTTPNKKTIQNPKPPSTNNNIIVTVDLRRSPKTTKDVDISKPPTAAAKDDDDAASYERRLESSKRKLEKGYAAHEDARKRSKVIDFHLEPTNKQVEEEFVLPLGPNAATTNKTRPDAALVKAAAAATRGGEATATTKPVAQTKAKPKPPRWWIRLKNERDDARVRSLMHKEIREQQRLPRSRELDIYS